MFGAFVATLTASLDTKLKLPCGKVASTVNKPYSIHTDHAAFPAKGYAIRHHFNVILREARAETIVTFMGALAYRMHHLPAFFDHNIRFLS